MAEIVGDLGVDVDELVAALEALAREEPDGGGAVTVAELAPELDWAPYVVRARLLELKKAGLLDVVWVKREDLSGRRVRRPGYRLRTDNET